jgi:hypothetical protein
MFLIEMFINTLFFNFFMKRVVILVLFLVLFVSGCEGVRESPERINVNEKFGELEYFTAPEGALKYEEGIIHVKFKEGSYVVYEEDAIDLVNNIKENNAQLSDVVEVKKVFMAKPGTKNYEIKKEIGLDRWVEIQTIESADVIEESEKWLLLKEIEKVALVSVFYPTGIPNDPEFDRQWHHDNTGNNIPSLPTTPDADIDSVEAWDIETGDVMVANFEPVQWYHEDIVDNIWQNLGEDLDGDGVLVWDNNLGRYIFDPDDENGIDDDGNGYPDDFIGWGFWPDTNDPYALMGDHGLKTAGALLAKPNNNLGVAGVCWDCKLILTNYLMSGPIEYVVDNGAEVMSISLLSEFSIGDQLSDAFEYAHVMGVVAIVSSGNDAIEDQNTLCEGENIICVASTDIYDKISLWTSYGNTADVGAPGDHIRTTYPDDSYYWAWGTSLSAPIVAGVVGLILAENPSLSPNEIISIIQSSTDSFVDPDRYAGNGRVNAHTALQLAESSLGHGSFPVAMINAEETVRIGNALEIYGTANSPDFNNYQIRYGEGFYPSSWTLLTQETAPVEEGLLYSLDLLLQPNLSSYQIQLVVMDTNGQSSVDSYYFLRELGYQPGWPQETGGSVQSSPALGDIDGDDELEIVVGSDDGNVYVWNSDGTLVPGWPQETGGSVQSSPALGDIDGDDELEIIVGSGWDDNGVYAWNSDGTIVPGWPQQTGDFLYSSPALGDIDGDDELEIIVGSGNSNDGKVSVWNSDGTIVPGWPRLIESYSRSSPALGDIDGDDELEIIVGSGWDDNGVYAWNSDGTIVPGWPQETGETSTYSPALGDIDGDGLIEIVVGSGDGNVYVWNGDGTIVPGWPQTTENNIYSSPTLGDIDGDNKLEIVVGSGDGKVYAWDSDGTIVPGWPQETGGIIHSSSALEDIDGDGLIEIVVGSGWDDNGVYAWNSYGTIVPGWPQETGGRVLSSPALGDIDGDGLIEIVVGSGDGNVYVWRTEMSYNLGNISWPMFGHDLQHTGNSEFSDVSCSDGTPIYSCSETQPLYCGLVEGESELINNSCGMCGCPVGKYCDNQTGICLKLSEHEPNIEVFRPPIQPKEIQEELDKKTKELPESKQKLSPLQSFWQRVLEFLF